MTLNEAKARLIENFANLSPFSRDTGQYPGLYVCLFGRVGAGTYIGFLMPDSTYEYWFWSAGQRRDPYQVPVECLPSHVSWKLGQWNVASPPLNVGEWVKEHAMPYIP